MTVLEFLLAFLLLLAIGPVVIVGWYAITRGRIEYTVGGQPFKTGKLFKNWHFFWNQHTIVNKIVAGHTLKLLLLKLVEKYPDVKISYVNFSGVVHIEELGAAYIKSHRMELESFLDCDITFADNSFTFLRDEKVYKFSEYVRDPLSECPTCMASVYGSIIWWTVNIWSDFSLFEWVGFDSLSFIIFWIFYCIGCAYVNTILAKKL